MKTQNKLMGLLYGCGVFLPAISMAYSYSYSPAYSYNQPVYNYDQNGYNYNQNGYNYNQNRYNYQGGNNYYGVPTYASMEGPTYYSTYDTPYYQPAYTAQSYPAYTSQPYSVPEAYMPAPEAAYYQPDGNGNGCCVPSYTNCCPNFSLCCFNPCQFTPCICGIEIGAEFLWWKPSVDDLDFAAERFDTGETAAERIKYKFHGLCQKWEPGVRGWIAGDFGCHWGFISTYQYIHASRKGLACGDASIVSPLLLSSLRQDELLFDTAEAKWDLNYQDVDFLLGFDISCNECYHLRPLIGVAGIWFTQDFETEFELTDDTGITIDEAKWDSNLWAIGLRTGFEFVYNFNSCLSFFTQADGSILTGKARSHHKHEEIILPVSDLSPEDNIYKIDDNTCWQVIPGYHIRAGLSFNADFCCTTFSLRVGYEVLHWQNLPNHRIFSDPLLTASSPNIRSIGFQGLFAGLDFDF